MTRWESFFVVFDGYFRDEKWTHIFSNFSGTPGTSRQKSRDITPKSWFPWVSKDIPNFFDPHPFTWKTPTAHAARRYPDQKVWVWVCLSFPEDFAASESHKMTYFRFFCGWYFWVRGQKALVLRFECRQFLRTNLMLYEENVLEPPEQPPLER